MNKKKLLEDIGKRVHNCKRCILYKTATHGVPGEGDPDNKIMFVGEAPGRVEDETGRPFVGRAGMLLNKLLESINLKRESVFITSVVKHRPPKNRPPKPLEVKACSFWLTQQLDIIKPKLICTMGNFALHYFKKKKKISKIHGTMKKITLENKTYMIFPLYHPAAGLRSTRNKFTLEEDFKKLQREIKKHDFI